MSQVILQSDAASSTYTVDVDGDGDMDVLSASSGDGKIVWYENIDGKGTFGEQNVVTMDGSDFRPVYSADIDGDLDMDVLSASLADGTITWYENTDEAGTFGPQQVITTEAEHVDSVYSADLDDDGDMDVLSAGGFTIAWYENSDGKGTFGERRVITSEVGGVSSVCAVDVDGDGDVDVLSGSYWDGQIAWYENNDGRGSFGPQQTISRQVDVPLSVRAGDLDGDGDMDVLSASIPEDIIAWYENTDGLGTFGDQQVITTETEEPWDVHAADVDDDGDMDVLSAGGNKITWHENTDGRGTFSDQQIITTQANGARSVDAADLDGDGDLDVLSASSRDGKIVWYEQRLVGDVNDDGAFNSSDLVLVLQTGEYEDNIRRNSMYDEGDWNQDGDFDSGDLVLAFQAGHYEAAATQPANQIAAAVDWLFAQNQRANGSRAYVA